MCIGSDRSTPSRPKRTRTLTEHARVAGGWWDESFWTGLHTLLDPVRVPYFTSALSAEGPSHVLDIGSGGGFVSAALASEGHEVVGLDISAAAAAAASDYSEGSFMVGDAQLLPFGDGSFDAVVCSEVLEHVHSPASVVSESARVLRPGGRFLFSTPNRTWLSRLILISLAQRWPVTRILPEGLHESNLFIRPSELGDLLADNGMRVEGIEGIGMSPLDVPKAALALVGLKLGRIGYAEAGRRVRLRAGEMMTVSYMGNAVRDRINQMQDRG